MAQEQETTSQQEKAQETTRVQVAQPPEPGTVPLEPTPRRALAVSEWASPFALMRRLMDEMDRVSSGFGFGVPPLLAAPMALFGRGFWVPAVETFERDGKLVLRMDLPGLHREDVDVTILGDELVVSGERKHEEERAAGARFYSERRYGSFERRLSLPTGIDPKSIEASFDNGVLEISVAVPGRPSRTIEIKSSAPKVEEGAPTGAIH